MHTHRVVAASVGLALVGTLNLGVVGAAEALPRVISIRGKEVKPQVFYIKGGAGLDFAGRKVIVQRKVRPGATWAKWTKDTTSKTGHFKVRVYRARGSRQTCYRVRAHAFNGQDKGTSEVRCIIRIGS